MATAHNPKVVTDNLEICLDPKDPNSLPSTSSTTIKSTGRKISNGAAVSYSLQNGASATGNSFMSRYVSSDGINDKINVGSGMFRSDIKAFTLECWVYPQATGNSIYTLGKARGAMTQRSIDLYDNDTNFYFYLTNTEEGVFPAPAAVATLTMSYPQVNGGYTNRWHHIVVTCESTTATNGVKVYAQGELHDQGTMSSYSHNYGNDGKNFELFGSSSSNYGFQGRSGLFRYYSSVLTADEVMSNYNSSKSLYGF